MKRNKFGLLAAILISTVAGAAFVLQTAMANEDKIEYNAVYDCAGASGSAKSKFKVISCKGPGKFDRCEVFYINELSPGGGNTVSTYRTGIEDDIAAGCRTKNGAVRSQPQKNEPLNNGVQTQTAPQGAVACRASSPDSDGKAGNDKTFRGVIRRLWEKEAREGSDGAVTITFENFVVGGSRSWRPTFSDAYSQADPKKPIYAVRTKFETCTDYRSAITKRTMERIYDCFVHRAGGWQCTQTGASGPLATKDKSEYIQKKR